MLGYVTSHASSVYSREGIIAKVILKTLAFRKANSVALQINDYLFHIRETLAVPRYSCIKSAALTSLNRATFLII